MVIRVENRRCVSLTEGEEDRYTGEETDVDMMEIHPYVRMTVRLHGSVPVQRK
jgi:hypothetical protein